MAAWDRIGKLPDSGFTTERLYEATAKPFVDLPRGFDDPAIDAVFSEYRHLLSHSHAYRICGDAVIEPKWGYVIGGRHTLLDDSLTFSEHARQREMHQYFVGFPPVTSQIVRHWPVVEFEQAVSLRIAYEENYWHAFNDVLSKLVLLDDLGVGSDVPVVVGRTLASKPFFRDILRRWPSLAKRVLVQHGGYVRAREIIYCRALSHQRRHLDRIMDNLGCPPSRSDKHRRIFLTRANNKKRRIGNMDEISRVCEQEGIDIVDTERLTLDEQMQLFSEAGLVIGIHGAGLTNSMFRRGAPLRVIEIFPTTRFTPTYAWMCQAYGYGYDAIQGSATPAELRHDLFHVDLDRLQRMIARAGNLASVHFAAAPSSPVIAA